MAQLEVYHSPPGDIDLQAGRAFLTGPEAHHLLRVRRARIGERVMLIDGRGNAWEAELVKAEKDRATLRLGEQTESWREPEAKVRLGLGIIKPDRFLDAVDMAVQLGVMEITPLISKRVDTRWSAAKQTRAERRALAAAKQCGRGMVPPVRNAQPLSEWCIEQEESALRLLCSGDGAPLPRPEPSMTTSVAVGCEGGFSEEEEALLIEHGFIRVSLGSRRLRSETAVASVVAQLLVEQKR